MPLASQPGCGTDYVLIPGQSRRQIIEPLYVCSNLCSGVGGKSQNALLLKILWFDNNQLPDTHIAYSAGGGTDIFREAGLVEHHRYVLKSRTGCHPETCSKALKK
jgi:hypothetical protein